MDERDRKLTQDEDWKREFRYVLFARRRSILSTAVVVLAGAIAIVLFSPRQYASSASVLVRSKRAELGPATLVPVEVRHAEVGDRDVISEMEILRSPDLAVRVVNRLAAQGLLEAAPARSRPDGPSMTDSRVGRVTRRAAETFGMLDRLTARGGADSPPSDMAHARRFLRHVDVTRVPASNVIRLRYVSHTLETAEAGLEALLDQYLQFRAELLNPVGQDTFFEDRRNLYRDELRAFMIQSDAEWGGANPAFFDMKLKGNLERLVALQKTLGELEIELATSSFLDNQPLKRRIDLAKSAIAELEAENRDIQRQRMVAEDALREAEIINQSLNTFAKRAAEARIQDSIAENDLAGEIRVLSRAAGSGVLVFPQARRILVLGLIAALATGLSVGFLAAFFDHTVCRPEDITRTTGLTVICSVPKL